MFQVSHVQNVNACQASHEIHCGFHTVQQDTGVANIYILGFCFLMPMSPSTNLKLKPENMTLQRVTFTCQSAHNNSAMNKCTQIKI